VKIWRYYEAPLTQQALEGYGRFARERTVAWSLAHKAELYLLSVQSFEGGPPREKREASFTAIYDALRGKGWQVARNGQLWNSDRLFSVLTDECTACSQGSTLSLGGLDRERDAPALTECVAAVKDLKTLNSGSVSVMAVAKFLHFFNPRLFPIYDNAVIQQEVLRVFREDFRPNRGEDGVGFYVRYVLWANEVLRRSRDAVMQAFERWFRSAVRDEDPNQLLPERTGELYATAFEFIAIGAMLMEKGGATRTSAGAGTSG
jgi:hypothetical protein